MNDYDLISVSYYQKVTEGMSYEERQAFLNAVNSVKVL